MIYETSITNPKKQLEFYKDLSKELQKENEKLKKIITEFAELNKDNQKYVDDLNFDITNLKISVSSFDESESSIQEIQERIGNPRRNCEGACANRRLSSGFHRF